MIDRRPSPLTFPSHPSRAATCAADPAAAPAGAHCSPSLTGRWARRGPACFLVLLWAALVLKDDGIPATCPSSVRPKLLKSGLGERGETLCASVCRSRRGAPFVGSVAACLALLRLLHGSIINLDLRNPDQQRVRPLPATSTALIDQQGPPRGQILGNTAFRFVGHLGDYGSWSAAIDRLAMRRWANTNGNGEGRPGL